MNNKSSIVESVKNKSHKKYRSKYMDKNLEMLIDYAKNVAPLGNVRGDATYFYQNKTYNIGRKIEYIREKYRKGELTHTEIKILERLGMDWRNAKLPQNQQENEM